MITETKPLLEPAAVEDAQASIARVVEALRRVILGKEDTIDEVVAALLGARPRAARRSARPRQDRARRRHCRGCCQLDFRRIQFTPDLLPTDITGSHILQDRDGRKEFAFHAGPVFTNLLLADEINRASPKTQSALLEAMQERCVTIFGETRPLPLPFFVLATQNPIELEGTYPLPEAQLDRFMFKVDVAGVDRAVLEEILTHPRPRRAAGADAGPRSRAPSSGCSTRSTRCTCRGRSRTTWRGSSPLRIPIRATRRTRSATFVKYGSSPRGAIAIGAAARGLALLRGKPNVGFDEIRRVAPAALSHRLVLDYSARLEGWTGRRLLAALLEAVPDVERGLPQTLEART